MMEGKAISTTDDHGHLRQPISRAPKGGTSHSLGRNSVIKNYMNANTSDILPDISMTDRRKPYKKLPTYSTQHSQLQGREAIRNVTKNCREELKQFLKVDSAIEQPAFGYPQIQFTPPNMDAKDGWYERQKHYVVEKRDLQVRNKRFESSDRVRIQS